jgi:hypothetical protein
MGKDPMAPRADDPFDGESPPDDRPYPTRPVSRTLTQRDFVVRRAVRFIWVELVASPS